MPFRRTLAIALLFAAFAAPATLADGDPASDYLISQQVYLPLSVSYSTSTGTELTRLLADSKLKGFPLKVAVIARALDLGSVPSLFGTPQRYADFLGREDYYFFKDELLVVMPQGYGLHKAGSVPRGDTTAIAALRAPHVTSGDALIDAAIRAVRVLAARRGLRLSDAAPGSSTRTSDRIEIIAGVLVLAALGFGVQMVRRRR